MKATVLISAAAIGAAAFAGTAMAHEMDADGDGVYSLAELRAEYSDLTDAAYADLDTNHDQVVDADELSAAWADGRLKPLED
ncbi:MAG: EF-hand domain-containing protein [Halocynthiibacter sp.]